MRAHKWLLVTWSIVGQLVLFAQTVQSQEPVVVGAVWDGSVNDWQSSHWTFTSPTSDLFPEDRPDFQYSAAISAGFVHLAAPVNVTRLDLVGPSTEGASAGTIDGAFDINTDTFIWTGGNLQGSGQLNTRTMSTIGPALKTLDGWQLDVGGESDPRETRRATFNGPGTEEFHLNNGAIMNIFGAAEAYSDLSFQGDNGGVNFFGRADLTQGVQFGTNVELNAYGDMTMAALGAPANIALSGGGSSQGHWVVGGRFGGSVTFDGGTRRFTLNGTSDFRSSDIYLRSGDLQVNNHADFGGLIISGGRLSGAGDIDSVLGVDFLWSNGTIGHGGSLRLANKVGNITSGGQKLLDGRRLLVGESSHISWIDSRSELLLSDAATIEVGRFIDPDHFLGISSGRLTFGPFREGPTGVIRHFKGESTAVINTGLVQVFSPTKLIGVKFENNNLGLLTIEALGNLELDTESKFAPGSTIHLAEGTLTSLPVIHNLGKVMGAGSIVSDVENVGVLQAGSDTPESETSLAIDITGDLALTESSDLQFPVLGRIQGTQYGYIHVTGSAHFNGDLNLNLGRSHGDWMRIGDRFTLLASDEPIRGAFANVGSGGLLSVPAADCQLRVFYGPGSEYDPRELVAVCVPEGTHFNVVVVATLLGIRPRRLSRSYCTADRT